jgi:hypothetical protein
MALRFPSYCIGSSYISINRAVTGYGDRFPSCSQVGLESNYSGRPANLLAATDFYVRSVAGLREDPSAGYSISRGI